MASQTILEKKSKEIRVLSEANREILEAIEHSNSRRRFWANLGYCALLLAVLLGIFYQFQLAAKNTHHIDCIIKDLSTPPPKGTPPDARKYISNLETDCNINFTK